ncbi:hypothetical protein D3C75_1027670 [compost metagenome]
MALAASATPASSVLIPAEASSTAFIAASAASLAASLDWLSPAVSKSFAIFVGLNPSTEFMKY